MGRITVDKENFNSTPTPSSGFSITQDSNDEKIKIKKDDNTVIVLDDLNINKQIETVSGAVSTDFTSTNKVFNCIGNSELTLEAVTPIGAKIEIINNISGGGPVNIEAGNLVNLVTKDIGATTLLNRYDRAIAIKLTNTDWYLVGASNDLGTNKIPETIPNLKVWHDFSSSANLVFSSGNFVEEAINLAPTGDNAVQSVASSQAEWVPGTLNGLGTLQFDGNDFYPLDSTTSTNIDAGQDFTIFTVARQSVAADSVICGLQRTTGQGHTGDFFNSGSNEKRYFMFGISGLDGSLPNRSTYSASYIRRNGVTADYGVFGNYGQNVNIGSNPSNNNLSMGGFSASSFNLTGNIAEIIIYGFALSVAQRDTILDYLQVKWGVS
jgi:hypothetical protein